MLERGSGHIVNVSSMGAHMISWGTSAYAASKGALELFTEALYLELAPRGVRAHLVVPGTTRTEFSTEREGNDPPMTNPADATAPEVVAAAIVGCLDDDRFVTYATEQDAATSASKAADPNAFLAVDARRAVSRVAQGSLSHWACSTVRSEPSLLLAGGAAVDVRVGELAPVVDQAVGVEAHEHDVVVLVAVRRVLDLMVAAHLGDHEIGIERRGRSPRRRSRSR